MRGRVFFFIVIGLLTSCRHEVVKEYDLKSGYYDIHRKCIYADKNDTLNYKQLDYYKSGQLLRKITYINGKANGEYVEFDPFGRIMIRANLSNNKFDGLSQEFDSSGNVASKSYYLNGTRILYSEIGYSIDGTRQRENFYIVNKYDSAFPSGVLIKQGDTILNDLHGYAVIEGDDTINTPDYCLKLKIYRKPRPTTKYEIAFGKPNLDLEFNMIDTVYFTANKENYFCGFKLKPGINHIFCRIIAHDDSKIFTNTYYVYKDVYVGGSTKSKVKL